MRQEGSMLPARDCGMTNAQKGMARKGTLGVHQGPGQAPTAPQGDRLHKGKCPLPASAQTPAPVILDDILGPGLSAISSSGAERSLVPRH